MDVRGEVFRTDGDARFAEHFSARRGERLLERCAGVEPGTVVLEDRVRRLGAAFVGPLRERLRDLPRREGEARGIRLRLEDVRCRRVDDEVRHLGPRRYLRDRDRVRRIRGADQEIDVLLHDQLLGEASRGFRRDARVVAFDQHDLAAGDRVAVLFHVGGKRRVGHLTEDDVVTAGVRKHDADLDRPLRLLRHRRDGCRHQQDGHCSQNRVLNEAETQGSSPSNRITLRRYR